MTGKTHQLIGITAGTLYYLSVAAPVYSPATLAAVLVGSHLSALLPDVDSQAAQIWQQLPGGKMVGKIASAFLQHRNLSHSILGLGLFGLIVHWLGGFFPLYWGIDTNLLLIVCLVAYASHLVADMITVEGIPLFFPYPQMLGFPPRPLDGMRIETGKWFENLIIFPLLVITFWLIIWHNSAMIKNIILK